MNLSSRLIHAVIIIFVFLNGAFTQYHDLMKLISKKGLGEQFRLWHYANQRSYDINSELGAKKFEIFKENVEYYNLMNSKNLGYTLGIGIFSDMEWDEVRSINTRAEESMSGYDSSKENIFDYLADLDDAGYAETVSENLKDNEYDWSYLVENYNVKDQLLCGSCWAFSVSSTIELFAKRDNVLRAGETLSPQHLIDCVSQNRGCEGGARIFGFEYVVKNGLAREADYPYVGKSGSCKPVNNVVNISKTEDCNYGSSSEYFKCNNTKMNNYISRGPYSSGIYYTREWSGYTGGIIVPGEECIGTNHAIVVLGINWKEDYITILNSHGIKFGNRGIAKLSISKSRGLAGCGALATGITLSSNK